MCKNVKCEIQWVDGNGKPTPDNSRAIGTVYCRAHNALVFGRSTWIAESAKFPICGFHLRRLDEAGMEHWVFEPFPDEPLGTLQTDTGATVEVRALPDGTLAV